MAVINERIKERRNHLKLTLEEVATQVGVSRQTIQRYESGVISTIPSDKIERLASALLTTPAYLMWLEEGIKKATPEEPAFALSAKEKNMIKKYRCLSSPAQTAVDVMIDTQYELIKPKLKSGEEIS